MGDFDTFLRPEKLNVNTDPPIHLVRRSVNFKTKGLDAGNGEAHRVIEVRSGDVVLSAWINVLEACPAYSTVDFGYGTIPNLWGNGLRLDSTGPVRTVLSASKTIDFISLDSGAMEMTEIEIDGAAYDDQVIVTPSVFTQDLVLTGYVSDSIHKRVTVQLANMTGEKMNLPSMTLNVVVNKAPISPQPFAFTAADTIDVRATTDGKDVNITSGIIDIYALVLKG